MVFCRSILKKKVAEQNISGNVDNPEGGMDALLQVAVCHKVNIAVR